jgi:CHAD domain-containing protein
MTLPCKQTLERELKLSVKRNFMLPPLPGKPLPPRLLLSTYYDTGDYRLAKAGITLRRRIEARKGVWQLKIPRDAARLELEFAGGRLSPPESLTKLLFAHLRGLPLQQIARLRTRRRGMQMVGAQGPLADVVVDSVTALSGRRVSQHLYELEVELTGGSEKDLLQIEQVLREAGAQEGDHRPKVFQVLGLELPVSPAQAPPEAPPVEQLKAMLQIEFQQLLAHDPGTRLGTDQEDLHRMRVATRRLRAYLKAAQPMLVPDWTDNIRTELAWLGNTLGLVRDLDVLLGYLDQECATLDLPERQAFGRVLSLLQGERAEARAVLLQGLESDRYLALLDLAEAAAQSPAVADATVSLMDIARVEYKKLRRAMLESGPEAEDKLLHQIRIKAKRARYAAELAESSAGKPATRFIRQCMTLQGLLGEHQDAVVSEQRLRKLLGQISGSLVALSLGRLIERQCERRRKVRTVLPKAWAKLQKRAEKAWG